MCAGVKGALLKFTVGRLLLLLFVFMFVPSLMQAQLPKFQHIIVVFQENRTPDNMFQGLCSPPYGSASSCSTTPTDTQYNIETDNWLDKQAPGGTVHPLTTTLAGTYDLGHTHVDFNKMCDFNASTGQCAMDGAGQVSCTKCNGTTQPQFRYIDNSTGIMNPYLSMITQYGWANYMFQTNQGPSFPAHQYIFGATSAPSAEDDSIGTFAAENSIPALGDTGCTAPEGSTVNLIDANGVENPNNIIYPCFEHQTLGDLLDAQQISWRFYTPNANGVWTSPNAINHLCVPTNGTCQGPDWLNDVDLVAADVLNDITNCKLRSVSWAMPSAQNSDHALLNDGGGPSWVASIVNAVGNSTCKNPNGTSYWDSTAIIISWDDWGGWYDHEPPTFLPYPQGGYQLGFRVPLIVVSAYTRAGLISNTHYDFGSVARFIEGNFGLTEGALSFADARATSDLREFFSFRTAPRVFQTIPSPKNAKFFMHDKRPQLDPDDD